MINYERFKLLVYAISYNTNIKSIKKKIHQTSLKRASSAAIKSPVIIVDGLLQI